LKYTFPKLWNPDSLESNLYMMTKSATYKISARWWCAF